jgi:hypothetical protein
MSQEAWWPANARRDLNVGWLGCASARRVPPDAARGGSVGDPDPELAGER